MERKKLDLDDLRDYHIEVDIVSLNWKGVEMNLVLIVVLLGELEAVMALVD